MPMITIRYMTPQPGFGLPERIAALATGLAAQALGKDPKVTAVLVEPADPMHWFIGGERPGEVGLAAFWLDIKVTAGTNSAAETTRFVEAAFAGMEELIGPLHPESYVLVHAVDGEAYGYGGRTQAARMGAAAARPG